MKIRKASKGDFEDIFNIFIKSSVLSPKDKKNNNLKKYIYDFLNKKDFFVLVAEKDKKVIGVAVTIIGKIHKEGADLLDFYILNEFRNQQIGSEMMGFLYKGLKEKGIKNLGLYSENNPKTLNFYKKQGFEIGRFIRRCDKKLK